jgi:hypothetical protein
METSEGGSNMRKRISIATQGHQCENFTTSQGLFVCKVCGQPWSSTSPTGETEIDATQTVMMPRLQDNTEDNTIDFRGSWKKAS